MENGRRFCCLVNGHQNQGGTFWQECILQRIEMPIRKWFEPRSNIPWLKKIIWVIGVLRWTVVGPSQDSNHPDDLFQSRNRNAVGTVENPACVCWMLTVSYIIVREDHWSGKDATLTYGNRGRSLPHATKWPLDKGLLKTSDITSQPSAQDTNKGIPVLRAKEERKRAKDGQFLQIPQLKRLLW